MKKKCKSCGKWWMENDRRAMSPGYAPPAGAMKRSQGATNPALKCGACPTWDACDANPLAEARGMVAPCECKSSGRNVSACCLNHPGDYCRNCNEGG